VFAVDDFMSSEECDAYVALSEDPSQSLEIGSQTFGSIPELANGRTSTTWFVRYKAVPELVERASKLLGNVDSRHFEEPQLVRYEPGQQFKWHLDEVKPLKRLFLMSPIVSIHGHPNFTSQVPPSMLDNGGQRLVTLIVSFGSLIEADSIGSKKFRALVLDLHGPAFHSKVYLNDMDDLGRAGSTTFRELDLSVKPRKGMALIFFPAFAATGTVGGGEDSEDASPAAAAAGATATTKSKAAAALSPRRQVSAGQGDDRTLHCGSPTIIGTKWIAQMWTHQRPYEPKVPPGNAH
jgi:hypothetical protein